MLLLLAAPPLAAQGDPVLIEIASGFSSPLYLTHPPGITDRLYVVEQGAGGTGRIKSIDTGTRTIATVLTLTDLVTGGERGLLGLAFHPEAADNGYLYVYGSVPRQGSAGDHDSWIRRYTMTGPDGVDPGSAFSILRFNEDFSNHNGGWMAFGPDDYLYIATGDGGSANDPNNNAQDLDSLLGKMLRIDVDGDDFPADPDKNYRIPPDNPFASAPGRDEIWAYGLRNPWRNSFDRAYGDLYIGDVGQGAKEEVDYVAAGSAGGLNFGWRVMEGSRCNDDSQTGGNPACFDASFAPPVYDYPHGGGALEGRSITGGYVYRGPSESLQGLYFFADFINDRIWSIRVDRTSRQRVPGSFIDWTETFNASIDTPLTNVVSFGEDEQGNVYIVSLVGTVYRIEGIADGDVNGDRVVDVQDAILALRILSGFPSSDADKDADVNGDGAIGLEEAIFVLQKAAVTRNAP
jgi:glucose/arabinose dehydrogenase